MKPHYFVGSGVVLGERVLIGPGAVILGPCTIEDDVFIGPGAQIGAPPEMTDQPQNDAWNGNLEHAGVHIRRRAVIREGVVIHQGSYRPTTVGEDSWVLNRAYIAHDALIGNASTISAGVSIGGHCEIGDRVNIGMNASIHQRVFISAGCMVGMGTALTRDLPPYAKAYGAPARVHGINHIGMRRQGISDLDIDALFGYYKSGDLLLNTAESDWESPLLQAIKAWRLRENRRPAKTQFVRS